jgi:hypothetical protein
MPKNIKQGILKKIQDNELKMRPKWVYLLGSALSALGLLIATGLSLLAIQLFRFRLTHPGIGAARKLDFVLTTLPWYIPLLAVVGLVGGYLLLRRYDFSYRKNLGIITLLIAVGLVLSSYLLDYLGFNSFLSRRGYFRQIYGQSQEINQLGGPGRGAGQEKGRMAR